MDWKVEGQSLVKEFVFNNFVEAVAFVDRIVPLAEEAGHHPDIFIHSYKKVKVLLSTHSENKITEKDYALAEKIDALL
ncbi:MAG: 4a-hydroxytetrahydrobiopterin dehydratase [Anaerolineae bacterium]|nr:4a-hydroxytetrahydrobiopterin dehydratase [Anaerolineae bacterium]